MAKKSQRKQTQKRRKQKAGGFTHNLNSTVGGQMERVGYSECCPPLYNNNQMVTEASGKPMCGGSRKKSSKRSHKKSQKKSRKSHSRCQCKGCGKHTKRHAKSCNCNHPNRGVCECGSCGKHSKKHASSCKACN